MDDSGAPRRAFVSFQEHERRHASASGAGASTSAPAEVGATPRGGSRVSARTTVFLTETYRRCNPGFGYDSHLNPRRQLTKPAKPAGNGGHDNENQELIISVNDVLIADDASESEARGDGGYEVRDVLGSGTFGQVVRCRARDSGRQAAVKVIKNHPAYFHQAHVEIGILHMLNTKCDERDEHHIVRMLDHFVHKSHLCIVFEVLNVNLYELLRQNNFRGLNAKLVRKFAEQLLRSLRVLRSANVIHCDLKPENILVKSLDTGEIKLIDFGSACFENRTVYQYIQSRFYRSPEVVLGAPYGMPIDMWSLGCVIAELFLGLPLFPGASEYNLMTRICETLGPPPASMLDKASNAKKFFRRETGGAETGGISAAMQPGGGVSSYRLKTLDEYEQDSKKRAAVGKKYFKHTLLRDIIAHGGGSSSSKTKDAGTASADATKQDRAALLDLLEGCLRADPTERWTPDQAAAHPFITEAPFVGAFTPPPPEEAGVAGEERVRREQSAARAAAKVARQGQAAAATADARPRDAMEPATPSSSLGKAPATPESVAAKPAAAGAPGGGLAAALAATSPASAADAQRALLLQQQQMFQQQQQLFQQQQQQQQQMAAGFSPGSFGGTPGSYGGSFGSSGFAPGALPFGMSPHALNSAALHPLHFGQSPPTSQLSAIGLAAGMQQAAAAAAAAAVQLPTLQPGVAESPGGPGFFPLGAGFAPTAGQTPPSAGGGSAFAGFGLQQQPVSGGAQGAPPAGAHAAARATSLRQSHTLSSSYGGAGFHALGSAPRFGFALGSVDEGGVPSSHANGVDGRAGDDGEMELDGDAAGSNLGAPRTGSGGSHLSSGMGNRKRSQDSFNDPADWDPNFSDELLFDDHGGGGGDNGHAAQTAAAQAAQAKQAAAYAAAAPAADGGAAFGGFPNVMSSSAPQWQSAGMTGRMHQQFGFAPPAPQGAATGGNFDAFVSQQQQQQMAAAAAAAVQYGQLAAGFAQQQQQQQQQQRRRDEERE